MKQHGNLPPSLPPPSRKKGFTTAKTYLFYILIFFFIILAAALVQNLVVLHTPLQNIQPHVFLIPTIVAISFGYLLAKVRLLQKDAQYHFKLLKAKDAELEAINQRQEYIIQQRTEELLGNRKLTQDILDAQTNIVMLTDGVEILSVNQAFFRFLPEYRDLKTFKQQHACICDFFESVQGNNYLQKTIEGSAWVEHIAKHPEENFQAMITRDHTEHLFDVKARALMVSDNPRYVATLTDISTLIYYKEKAEAISQALRRQLYIDNLTGLPNRLKLLEDIQMKPVSALLLIDIDAFKEINDFFGHNVGDSILLEISERIKPLLNRSDETLYRISGDEYAILIKDHPTQSQLDTLAQSIDQQISNESFSGNTGSEIHVRVTIGIVASKNANADHRLIAADLALKTAKRQRKSRLNYSNDLETRQEYGENIHQAKTLKYAIDHSLVQPYFQPIINNITQRIEKYECLARITNENGEVITPDRFINAAKTTKLYPHITRTILEQACAKFKNTPYEFSINISIEDIVDNNTVTSLLEQIRSTGIGNQLVFELLESEGIENLPQVMSFIEQARALGCKIAIDDFGTGYSNFEYIIRMKVDYLKIDASLIKNIDHDNNALIVVRTIHNFARELGIQTIAEYIHSEAVYNTARAVGLDYSQGFHIGRPLPELLPE